MGEAFSKRFRLKLDFLERIKFLQGTEGLDLEIWITNKSHK